MLSSRGPLPSCGNLVTAARTADQAARLVRKWRGNDSQSKSGLMIPYIFRDYTVAIMATERSRVLRDGREGLSVAREVFCLQYCSFCNGLSG